MNNLTREDTVFGKRANVIGNISADLVLESLGKVYIKSRNSAKTLEEVIKSLTADDLNITSSKIQIIDGIESLETDKDGILVYDKSSSILYLILDGEPIELINVTTADLGYVKRTGDTMTGKLSIKVPNGPPLYVNSTDLVLNLNAEYLRGESGKNFTKRASNEVITGSWKFLNPTSFASNALFSLDVTVNGSIGSSDFAGGLSGYGWKLEATTNTLTIDNLVVRKLMQVYELVVNRISATNGSLWVSNAGKVYKAQELVIKDNVNNILLDLSEITESYNEDYESLTGFNNKSRFILVPSVENKTLSTSEIMNSDGTSKTPSTVYNTATRRAMRLITIKDYSGVFNISGTTLTSNIDFTSTVENNTFSFKLLFDDNFRYDTELPIVPRNYRQAFEISEEHRKIAEEAILNLGDVIDNTPTEEQLNMLDAYNALLSTAKTEISSIVGNKFDSILSTRFLEPSDIVVYTLPYYKYFARGSYYYVEFDSEFVPTIEVGDLLRCQKWTYGGIKYYDAIVCNHLEEHVYIILLANDFYDNYSRLYYEDSSIKIIDGENNDLYRTSTTYIDEDVKDDEDNVVVSKTSKLDKLGIIEKDDSLVLIGNLWNTYRQNAVYITSTDDGAPYLDVLSGINRPDYSIIYNFPAYLTVKLYKTLEGIPYTGNYYILKTIAKADYLIGKKNGNVIFIDLSNTYSLNGVTNITYLALSPNSDSILGNNDLELNILLEDNSKLLLEDNNELLLEAINEELILKASKTTKVRLGNLDGIQDDLFPKDKLPYGYGLYGLNVFLVGEFYLNNGKSLAEISEDTINFAISAYEETNNSINYTRQDIVRVNNTLLNNINVLGTNLNNNYYTKKALKTAGMSIVNLLKDGLTYPSLALWGNMIMLATTKDELEGKSIPTAMFYKGRIRSKFLEIDEVHNTTPLFKIDGVGSKSLPALNYLNYWTGGDRLYRHTYYINISTNETPNYQKSCEYIREFSHNGNTSFWAVVDIKGNPLLNNGAIQYPSIYDVITELEVINGGGIYDKITSVAIKEVNKGDDTIVCTLDDNFFVAFNEENDEQGTLHQVLNEFKDELSDLYPVLWSLEANGSGNLGGDSFTWDTEGNVTMTGTIYADAGKIGGFNLSSNKMYSRKNNGNDPTYFYLANDTTLPCVFLSTQHSNHNIKGLFTCKSLTFQDYYINNSNINQVMLNTEGLTWNKSGVKMGALSIIASIMVMPIWCGNSSDKGMIPYVVVSAADPSFRTVDVCMGWDSWNNHNMGLSVVCFPELDANSNKSSFIANGIRTGKITINVTSLLEIDLDDSKYNTIKSLISGGMFNPDTRQYEGLGNSRVGIRNLCFASGGTTFGIPYTGDLRSNFKIRTILEGNEYGNGVYTFYKDKTSDNTTVKNYIELWAGDDDSPNSAGYFINILYNNYIADTDMYMDLLDIIDSINSGKTSEEVRTAYESYYDSTLYEYNMWSVNIARLLNKYNDLSTKYYTQLSNLNIALNGYHAVYDQSDIWYEGNETLISLRANLEAARQVVSDIYQLEIAKDNWLSRRDSAYELTTELQSIVSTLEYSDLLSKYNEFDYQCTYANLNDDWFRTELTTTHRAWSLRYNQLIQAYLDEEVRMEIPVEQN